MFRLERRKYKYFSIPEILLILIIKPHKVWAILSETRKLFVSLDDIFLLKNAYNIIFVIDV